MSKSLEALKRIRQETCPATYMPDFDKEECCKIIEKDLIAVEIIFNKLVHPELIRYCPDVKTYNFFAFVKYPEETKKSLEETFGLTEDEFKLLKEVYTHVERKTKEVDL